MSRAAPSADESRSHNKRTRCNVAKATSTCPFDVSLFSNSAPNPFIPPFFTPPGQIAGERGSSIGNHVSHGSSLASTPMATSTLAPTLMDANEARSEQPSPTGIPLITPSPELGVRRSILPPSPRWGGELLSFPHAASSQQLRQHDTVSEAQTSDSETLRMPSPPVLDDPYTVSQRDELWSNESRKAFQLIIEAPGYISRYRLAPAKAQRMIQFLSNPDTEAQSKNTKDHQTKYQSHQWVLRNGHLYRKPETGRIGCLRRHIGSDEAWEVLTAEHVRSEHLGRDKLRKLLEKQYIGYTLQEVMFVLKECKKCNKHATRKKTACAHCLHAGTDVHHGNHTQVEYQDATTSPAAEQLVQDRGLISCLDPALMAQELQSCQTEALGRT